jgi:polyphosphate kinase
VAVPIYDHDLQQELRHYMGLQFRDNTKARVINEQQDNIYRKRNEGSVYRSQLDTYGFLKDKLGDAGVNR